jgi:hypothetical protein
MQFLGSPTRVLFQSRPAANTGGSARFSARSPSSQTTTRASSGSLSDRWNNLPSFSNFHSSARAKVVGDGSGQAGWWWRKPIGWLIDNVGGLIAYQMVIEAMFSGAVAGLLLNHVYTVASLRSALEATGNPLVEFINWDGCVYEKGLELPESLRPFVVVGNKGGGADDGKRPLIIMDADACTALHTGHNVSMGFMPVQMVFLFATYPLVKRVWPLVRRGVSRIPLLGWAFRPVAMPAEVAARVNSTFGTTLGGAAIGGSQHTRNIKGAGKAGMEQRSGVSSSQTPKWRSK